MKEQKCKICGCTNERACNGGCSWVKVDICSNCFMTTKSAIEEIEKRIDTLENCHDIEKLFNAKKIQIRIAELKWVLTLLKK